MTKSSVAPAATTSTCRCRRSPSAAPGTAPALAPPTSTPRASACCSAMRSTRWACAPCACTPATTTCVLQAAIERLGAHRDGVIRQHKRHQDGAARHRRYSILDNGMAGDARAAGPRGLRRKERRLRRDRHDSFVAPGTGAPHGSNSLRKVQDAVPDQRPRGSHHQIADFSRTAVGR